MSLTENQIVMLPGYAPYPRYGRIAAIVDADLVRVTNVHCGDPRCAAEHHHADLIWSASELAATAAYQPRAPWEHGRKGSPNAPVS